MRHAFQPLLEAERAKGAHRLKFITLTQSVDINEDPRESRTRLREAFRRLTRRVFWKTNVTAWLSAFEETFKDERGWHSHVHIIASCPYLVQNELHVQWASSKGVETKDSALPHITVAQEGTEKELLKYALKAASLPAERLVQYALKMRGLRDVSAGGEWFGLNKALTEAEDLEEGDVSMVCLPFVEVLAAEGEGWARQVLRAVSASVDGMQEELPRVHGPP